MLVLVWYSTLDADSSYVVATNYASSVRDEQVENSYYHPPAGSDMGTYSFPGYLMQGGYVPYEQYGPPHDPSMIPGRE
jgi:hypothetical protein